MHLAEKPSSTQVKNELLTLQALPIKKRKKLLRGVRKDLKEEILRHQVEEKPLTNTDCDELELPFVFGTVCFSFIVCILHSHCTWVIYFFFRNNFVLCFNLFCSSAGFELVKK